MVNREEDLYAAVGEGHEVAVEGHLGVVEALEIEAAVEIEAAEEGFEEEAEDREVEGLAQVGVVEEAAAAEEVEIRILQELEDSGDVAHNDDTRSLARLENIFVRSNFPELHLALR